MIYMRLFLSFFQIGIAGFGGGYAMLTMIFTESRQYGITVAQFADLNALDMIVPGPIAINAATYVGYMNHGVLGALAATLGVMLPSFIVVPLAMVFIEKFRHNRVLNGVLTGIKPAAVGLVAAAALTIAGDVLLREGKTVVHLLSEPLTVFSWVLVVIFVGTAVANIKFKVNPILLTVLAGVLGAIFVR